jgi:hypothetical protein
MTVRCFAIARWTLSSCPHIYDDDAESIGERLGAYSIVRRVRGRIAPPRKAGAEGPRSREEAISELREFEVRGRIASWLRRFSGQPHECASRVRLRPGHVHQESVKGRPEDHLAR